MRIVPETRSSAGPMGVLRMILNKDMTSEIYDIFSIFFELFYERHILVLSIVALTVSFLLSSKDSIQYNRDGKG